MKNLKGQTVWITGASSGIGKALAIEFAKEGCNLILTARNEEKLNEVKKLCEPSNCHIFAADLSQVDQLENLVQKVSATAPTIDILINNAGISQRSFAKETGLEIDRKIMELNFFSAVALTKLVLPGMLAKKSGHIAVISSISGLFGFPLRTAYAASKHALKGFFESLRPELSNYNIAVSIISPGRINTPISLSAITKDGTPHGQMDQGQTNGMDVDICAQKIIKALKKRKKDILVGQKEILLVYIHRFFPFLYHKIVNKISAK